MAAKMAICKMHLMHIAVHQYLIVKIIPLSHRLCTRLCTLIHTTGTVRQFTYHMKGKQLEEVNSEKDLGVIISSNLKVADHCRHAYATANRMLGLLSRTVKFRNVDIMVRLYKSLVRPHLEYSASIWNPHYEKDKVLLEKVQRRFTRLFKDLRSRNMMKD